MRKTCLRLLGAAAALISPVIICAQSAGNAENGKKLYMSYSCYSCHSFDGNGGAGARLVPMPLTEAQFTQFVRHAGRMPSYSAKVISDQQLADIYAYVKTLPVSKPLKEDPLLLELVKEQH